jgi:hypothetical protein
MKKYPATMLCLAVLTAFMSSVSKAQNDKDAAYYCTAEAAGGLEYNKANKKWGGAEFLADHKFVLGMTFLRTSDRKKENELQGDDIIDVYGVTITDAGKTYAAPCVSRSGDREVSVSLKYNMLFCDSSLVEYRFNLNRNRFLQMYAGGYALGFDIDDEHSDTPVIQSGTCTKIR